LWRELFFWCIITARKNRINFMVPEDNFGKNNAGVGEDPKLLRQRVKKEKADFDAGAKTWEELSAETQEAIQKTKRKGRQARKIIATGGRRNKPGNVAEPAIIEQEEVEDIQQEAVTNLPKSVVSDKEENPIEEMEALNLRRERLEQELGLAETEFEEAELKYEQKKADNKETFKGLMATLRIKSFGGGQVKAEEEFFRKKMEEKKQIVEELKKKIQELEPEQEKEVPNPVFEGFKELRIKKEELEKMDGFENLSEGQRLLVLENLKQLTLGRIQEEAVENVNKDIAGSNILGKIWKNVSKKYYIAKKEKVNAKELMGGGMSVHEETLKQLVAGAKDGPAVEIKDGKLEIQYVSGLNNLTPEQEGQVAEFNTVATEFSKIPYEWSLDTASAKEKEKYQEVNVRYQKAVESILEIKSKEDPGNYASTILYVNDLERSVKLNQFLNSNPDVERQLANIKDDSVWQKALANVITERGIYAGAGFLARTATVSLIGLAGVPLVAAGMGGILARKRAKETLRDKERMARRGIEDESAEKKDFVDAMYLQESIGDLMEMIKAEPKDSSKREEMLRSLKFNLFDAKNKLDDGTVNFGNSKEKLSNQYGLMKKISEGVVFLEAHELEISFDKYFGNLENKGDLAVILEFLETQDLKITEAQKKFLRKQTIKGVLLGASFASAGMLVRHVSEAWFGWGGAEKVTGGGTEKSAETVKLDQNLDTKNAPDLQDKGGDSSKIFSKEQMPDPRGENKVPLKTKISTPTPKEMPNPSGVEIKAAKPILAEKLVPGSVEKMLDGVEVKPKIPADTMTIGGKGKERIPNIERGLIRKAMAELGISKKEAGALASRMTSNYIKEHPLSNPHLVHDNDIVEKIDFKNETYGLKRVSDLHGGAHGGGVAVEDARMKAITEQMNQEDISRSYNNQIMGEYATVPEAKTQAFSSSDGDRLHQGEVKTQAFSTSDGDRFRQAELEKTKMFSSSDGDRLHPNAPEAHAGASDGDRFHPTETRSIEHAGASEGDRFTPTEAKNLEHSGASDGDRFQPTQARSLEHVGASDGDRFNPVELSLLEKANIKKVADIFDDSIFGGNKLANQIAETKNLKGAEFYRAYREIYAKIIGNTFRENGISALNAGEYLEDGYGNNSKIDALIKYNSNIKGYSVEPNATETMGEWMTRNIDKALGSCGIGLNNTRFNNRN